VSVLGNMTRVATVKEVESRLAALEAEHAELVAVCKRLIAHAEVLGVALRSREAVPADDLDDAIDGLHELHAELADALSGG
jgi:hypothetical protein